MSYDDWKLATPPSSGIPISFAPEKPKEVNVAYEAYLKNLREKNQLKKIINEK